MSALSSAKTSAALNQSSCCTVSPAARWELPAFTIRKLRQSLKIVRASHKAKVHRISARRRLLNFGRKGRDGRLVGLPSSAFEENFSRNAPSDQGNRYDRSQGLYAMEPNQAGDNLKQKTGEQHITGYARAAQIMVITLEQVGSEAIGCMCLDSH
jgi:hypothetical protein